MHWWLATGGTEGLAVPPDVVLRHADRPWAANAVVALLVVVHGHALQQCFVTVGDFALPEKSDSENSA